MRHRSRPRHALILLLAAPLLAGAAPEDGVDVSVTVTDLRNSEGVVRACMTDDPEHFPRCRDDAHSYRAVVPAGEATTLHFSNVVPGTYAIALLHDENENARPDRALTLIPREGFGFSRDAPVRMGPPDFEDAAITITDAPVSETIRMRYML